MNGHNYQPAAPLTGEMLVAGGSDLQFVWPNGASRCTWQPGAIASSSPHQIKGLAERPAVFPNILNYIGGTPMVRLNNIPKADGVKCEIFAKCEFFNPGGSVKDRIGFRMVEDAESRGLLKPGSTIIEPTSGNTGIGLAMAAAVKKYRCIIVMPLKMSNEKVDALKALGAEIIRTPTAAAFDDPDGLMAVAQKLCRETPNSIVLDQYRNASNPLAHYEQTAAEILQQCGGKIDAIVCSAGTGGTISGIGRKIKEVCPGCKIIAADPEGSSLALPEEKNKTDVTYYEVEGIGYDFIPTVLDRDVVDVWYKTKDKESLVMARRLIREEGLLCGGSSGSAMSIGMKVAKTMTEGQRLVVLLPDGMRNYMTKFINDSWMQIRGFQDLPQPSLWWSKLPVANLNLPKNALELSASEKVKHAISVLKGYPGQCALVVENGLVKGCVHGKSLLSSLMSGRATHETPVMDVIVPIRSIKSDDTLQLLSLIVEKEDFALISYPDTESKSIVTVQDLLSFINRDEK